jgi:hypothetical protein
MRDPELTSRRRIQIRIEHAGPAAELELEARAFAYLERGMAEMANELVGGESDEVSRLRGYGLGRRRLLDRLRLLLRTRSAGGKRQGERGED